VNRTESGFTPNELTSTQPIVMQNARIDSMMCGTLATSPKAMGHEYTKTTLMQWSCPYTSLSYYGFGDSIT